MKNELVLFFFLFLFEFSIGASLINDCAALDGIAGKRIFQHLESLKLLF